jgi:Putative conjugal transfer nickase/helicase TraI C-term/Putative helicase
MAAIETVRSRPPDALRAPGRPVTADPVALLRARLAFPREVFDVLVEQLIRGLAGCVPSARHGDAAADTQPLGPSVRLALRALAIRRDRMLPPNAPPERVGELAHRWTYAVLLAAMLRKAVAPGSGSPDSRYECIVPELGRVWIGQDPEASAALAEVLSDRCGQDNPILAILTEALSSRSDAAALVDRAQRHQHASRIDPTAASDSEPPPARSASQALATHASQASLSAPPLPELFGWLRDELAGGSIEINTRTALIHHVPEGLLLVSPGIFRSFLAWQGADANSQEALKRLQRSVLKAEWHLVGADGASVLGYAWIKNGKTTARVHGIVIEQPQRLLDPLPPINPRLARIAVAGGSDP